VTVLGEFTFGRRHVNLRSSDTKWRRTATGLRRTVVRDSSPQDHQDGRGTRPHQRLLSESSRLAVA